MRESSIAAVIGRKDHRLRHRDRPFADLLAVDKERHLAALAEASASIGEFHANLMVAGGQGVR